jgi:uncharacterized membrane protein (UPF0127 family)
MRRLLASAVALAVVAACRSDPRVSIVAKDGRSTTFQVEIADTPAKREMGLQYRRELAGERGMIFVFSREEPHSFWMKNTPISLDMIFVSADQRIVGIVENAVPFSLDGRAVAGSSKYVLEINGGLARRHGFAVGDSVRFEGFRPEAAD